MYLTGEWSIDEKICRNFFDQELNVFGIYMTYEENRFKAFPTPDVFMIYTYINLKKECDKLTICRDAIHRVFTQECVAIINLIGIIPAIFRLIQHIFGSYTQS